MAVNQKAQCRRCLMAKSLDFDLASIQVAKGSLDVPQVFKHSLGFSSAFVKFFGEVRGGRKQELYTIPAARVCRKPKPRAK